MTTMTATRETAYDIEQALDPRNVHDQFKGLSDESLLGEFEKARTPLITVALNLSHDFNKATILRTFVGAGGGRFYFLNKPNNQIADHPEGTKHWDKRGTVGMHNYASIEHYDINRYKELFDELRAEGYTIIAVDNTPGYDPQLVYDVELPEKSVFIMGEEKLGIPTEIIDEADMMVFLPMLAPGPRSYNVSVAAAGVTFEYLRQNRHLMA